MEVEELTGRDLVAINAVILKLAIFWDYIFNHVPNLIICMQGILRIGFKEMYPPSLFHTQTPQIIHLVVNLSP